MTKTTTKPHRILNDLAESLFQTPKDLNFIRYGKRKDADYKISKQIETDMHLIEVNRGGLYSSKWVKGWDAADNYLAYLCQKFGNSARRGQV